MSPLGPPKIQVEDSGIHDANMTESPHARTEDAEMTEINESQQPSTPKTNALQIPRTVVEKVEPDSPSYGEVPGTLAHDMRRADAEPDEVVKAPDATRAKLEGQSQSRPRSRSPTSQLSRSVSSGKEDIRLGSPHLAQTTAHITDGVKIRDSEWSTNTRDDGSTESPRVTKNTGDDAGDDFGDDFDDFEEGGDGDVFGLFDETVVAEAIETEPQSTTTYSLPIHSSTTVTSDDIPNISFDGITDLANVTTILESHLAELFKAVRSIEDHETSMPQISASLLNERSQSLWLQLVAPPPLQPPNWVQSRIRRLFLVSLGVPVDLDEILPASKQQKLVLPNVVQEEDRSPSRTPTLAIDDSITRLKQQNDSDGSLHSSLSKAERRRRGPAAAPDLDLNHARLLCTTTLAALSNLTVEELEAHTGQLQDLRTRVMSLQSYWISRKEAAEGDKAAFEEVIENLVKHAKKIRK